MIALIGGLFPLSETDITKDAFLGGRLILQQPKAGYRAGQDPVLLAAATPIRPGEDFVDMGCGVGVLSLCLFARVGKSKIKGTGIEVEADLANLARTNAQQNQMQNYEIVQGDFFLLPPVPKTWVLSNPPFFKPGSGRLPKEPQRLRGRHGSVEIGAWVHQLTQWVRPRGYLGLILNTAQVQEVMAVLGPSFGGITLIPLLGNQAKVEVDRCLLFARQGSKGAFQIGAPFIIRGPDGEDTPQARSILMDMAMLEIPFLK